MKSRSLGRRVLGALALSIAALLTAFLVTWGAQEEVSSHAPMESASVGGEQAQPEVQLAPVPGSIAERSEIQASPTPPIETQADNATAIPDVATVERNFRLVTTDGVAVAGCFVQLSLNKEAQELISDAHGCFGFESRAEVPWSFEASLDEKLRSGVIRSKTVFIPKTDPQDIVLFALQRVSCRVVLDDGSGVPGASVSVKPIGQILGRGIPRPVSVRSELGGCFVLQLEGPGPMYELHASLGELESRVIEFRPEEYADKVLKVQLGALSASDVLVVDPTGRPCPGARVTAFSHWTGNLPAGCQSSEEWVTDEHGFAKLERSSLSPVLLLAEHVDWSPSTPLVFGEKGSVPEGLVRLQLVERTRIAGVLVWEDGSPARAASAVALRDESDGELGAIDEVPRSHTDRVYGFLTTNTDEQGRFEFTEIRKGPATYRLYFTPDGSPPDHHQWQNGVLPGTTDLKVVLSESQLRGSVLEARIALGETESVLQEVTYHLYEKRADGNWGTAGTKGVATPNGVLIREGLTPGVEYAVAISPIRGYLSGLIPPWRATDEVHSVQVTLRAPIYVEFLLPESVAPGAGAVFRVSSLEFHPHEVAPLLVDPDSSGRLRLPLWTGRFRAYVLGAKEERLYETEFDIARGSGEMTIQLEE